MKIQKILAGGLISLFLSIPALGGSHNWRWSEVFTNSDGRVQFLELHCLSNGENGIDGLDITVVVGGNTVSSLTIPAGALPGTTGNKKLLFATDLFAALPGAPTRNYAIPIDFIPTSGAFTLRYNPPGNYDTNTINAGVLPTDGVNSLKFTSFNGGNTADTFVTNQPNDPTNYNGDTEAVMGNIPTVGEWGVVVIALSLLAAGTILLRQRAGHVRYAVAGLPSS